MSTRSNIAIEDPKTKTITINGLDLLKAMENAKTPINPFYKQKGKNVKNKTKPRVQKQDRKSYASTLGTRKHTRKENV